jgi:XTP/dITP diphosphohydrolase
MLFIFLADEIIVYARNHKEFCYKVLEYLMLVSNKLLLATNNVGKIEEYRLLFSHLNYQLTTPEEQGISIVINETANNYRENAKLKALTYAKISLLTCVADDSGLEVDALEGKPGVLSARFGGENATDADNVHTLLLRLKNIPWENRTARFKCVIAIAYHKGRVELCSGVCLGIITFEPRGENGFGYDPVFYLPELNKTMAELSKNKKNEISHRAKAALKAEFILKQYN